MTAERNLVLVHTYGFQDVGDFQEIARIVQEIAPRHRSLHRLERYSIVDHSAPRRKAADLGFFARQFA